MASTFFEWSRRFETGLADVDHQHRQLVDMLNAMGGLAAGTSVVDTAVLDDLQRRLADYAIYHFQEEEDLMAGAGIDPRHLAHHRAQHRYYVDELMRLSRESAGGEPGAVRFMLDFLTSWLAYHILGTDQAMARQLAAIRRGENAARAYAAEKVEQERAGGTEPLLAALRKLFEQVSERNRQLESLTETLEARVAERTMALSETVARLEEEKAESQRLGAELAEANRHLKGLAMTDALTGLPNRRHAMASLEHLWQEAVAEHLPLAVIMIDLDNFKPVNDTWGHDAGDEVLKAFARELKALVRTDDIACRTGGDEFLVICPRTPLDGAGQVAEAVWGRVSGLRVAAGGGEWRGSLSAGVAARGSRMNEVKDLLKAADESLYAAKVAGRGCVRTA